jgi:hypothetical protein
MTDEKRDDFKFLDDVEEGHNRNGFTWKVLVGVLLGGLVLASSLWWGKATEQPTASKATTNDPKTQNVDAQTAAIIDFADRFSIMAFNISYTDINRQTDKIANLMSDNMMSYYQEAFLDPKWVAFLRDNKAYVSYQGVERTTIENSDGSHYWVKVIGKCLYNSDARGPGSQIELPFHLVVVVKVDGSRLVVTNFQRI